MAEEKRDLPKPPMPPPPSLRGGSAARPGAPALPPLPPLPTGGAPSLPPLPPTMRGGAVDLERRLSDTEKRLHEEREKILAANLRQQDESSYALKVESAIKDVQEKLRNDRREADMEETRFKLETRVAELESRLIQERETWVTALKGQMRNRELQDQEIETHFANRMQEMERRWLEEKAQWQKVVLSKDEEIRNLRALAEKLKGIELEFERASKEKQYFEHRNNDISQELASAQAQLKAAAEHEKAFFDVRAEMTVAKEQARMLQEKLDREIQTLRIASKEREERLLADNERLQRDVQSVAQRMREEGEVEVKKYKAQADLAGAALQRMRAVGSALERQVGQLRGQAEEAKRYRAEFVVLQRRWAEREKEIRREAETAAAQAVETEKVKLKLKAQEEIQARVHKVQEQLGKEMENQLQERVESEVSVRANRLKGKLQEEVDALHQELRNREALEKERLLVKEAEIVNLRSTLDELRGQFGKQDQWSKALSHEKENLEKQLLVQKEEVRRAHEIVEESKGRLAKEEEWKRVLLQEKANLEKMVGALQEELGRHLQSQRGGKPAPPDQGNTGLLGKFFHPPQPPQPPAPPR